MHDPFAMRPFFGYNFGDYLRHWLDLGASLPATVRPAMFMINWFRRSSTTGGFLWPGFGENIRVIDWIVRRAKGQVGAEVSPVGLVPARGDIALAGLDEEPDMEELMSTPADFWVEEVEEMKNYFEEQVGRSLPQQMSQELQSLRQRLN